jgi:hypothetical protein
MIAILQEYRTKHAWVSSATAGPAQLAGPSTRHAACADSPLAAGLLGEHSGWRRQPGNVFLLHAATLQ